MNPKVLIIDDDLLTLKILKKHLEEAFDVQLENEGYRFIENMDMYEADLILLDMDMPIINGLQVLESISHNNRFANTPVAFLSGVYSPELVNSVMSKGASGYIVKTLPRAELIAQIKSIMSKTVKRSFAPEVAVLDSDIEALRCYKKALEDDGMKVKLLPTAMSLAEHFRTHKADVLVIGHDTGGNSPEYVRGQLPDFVSANAETIVLMEETWSSDELIEKVREALGK